MSKYLFLLILSLLYSFITIVMKETSSYPQMSVRWVVGYAGVLFLFFIYALLWQQVLKKVTLVTAYAFKGTCIIFTLLFSMMIFGEVITVNNVIGSLAIIAGIILMFA